MAISSSYYINAPSLGSATAVFTDSALLICATDGFYSDGIISREQVGCVLLPQQTCPSCVTPCGVNISASGTQGIYLLDLDTGTAVGDIGAVIVRFDPFSVPDGIRGTLGANVYNKLTSSVDGLHESTNAGAFTYVGSTGGDCGISGTTYPALIEYLYDGTAFYATGNTQSVTVAPGDVSLGAFAPGNCLMVIPKTTSSPSIINFEVVGPCSGTAWDMSVACPVLLTGFSSSVMAASSAAVCLLSETVTYYNASLPNTPGIVGLYDFVYSDAYGSTQLPAGFYLATGSIIGGNDWFEVDADGVVISLGVCAPPVTTFTGDFTLCVQAGSTANYRAQDGSATSGHFTTTATITAPNCSGPVNVSGTLTSAQGPLIILVPSVPSGSTATIVAQGIGATNAVITTGVVSGILRIIITPNSYPSTVTLNGTLTVTFAPPVVSYNCISGVCTDPGDGSGTYATLGACQSACMPPAPTAVIAFDLYDDGSGSIRARATVTSGTTLDVLYITGTVNGYQSLGCSGVQVTNPSLSDVLGIGSPSVSSEVFGAISAILSAQYVPLIVDGNTISVFSQDITVGGHIYTITGGTNCYTPL